MRRFSFIFSIFITFFISINCFAAKTKSFYIGLGYEIASIKSISEYKNSSGNYTLFPNFSEHSNELKSYFGWNFMRGEKFSLAFELGYNFAVYIPKEGGIFSNDFNLDLTFGYKIIEEIKAIAQIGGGYIYYGTLGSNNNFTIKSGYMDTNVGFEFSISNRIAVRTVLESKYLIKAKPKDNSYWFSSIGFSMSLQYRF